MGGSNSEEAIDLGDYCLTLGPGSAQWSIVIVIVIVFSTIVIIVVKLLLLHRLKISPYPNTEWVPMYPPLHRHSQDNKTQIDAY